MSEMVKLKEILSIKTGKYDANHAEVCGKYNFFTCAIKPLKADTYSFDDEVIILPGNGANVGEVLYFKGKLEAYQRTYILHNINAEVKYLFYFLKTYWKRHTTKNEVGSATYYIKLGHITEFMIPLPSITKQKEIAKTLDKAKELIALRKESINKLDELSKSIFIDMFGDPVSNPKKLTKQKLSQIAKVQTGNTPPRKDVENYGNYIEWIKSDNILKDKYNMSESKEYLSKEGYSKGRVVPVNSLLVTCIAGSMSSIGNVNIVDREVAFNQQINSITPYVDNIYYLYYVVRLSKKYIEENSSKSMKIMVNKTNFENLEFMIPDIEVQESFAKKIQKIEEQKSLYQEELKKLQENFDSLLAQSFKA
jgi:type I restriction enzyme S subunit